MLAADEQDPQPSTRALAVLAFFFLHLRHRPSALPRSLEDLA